MNGQSDELDGLRRAVSELERQMDAVRRIAVRLSTATELHQLIREALDTSLILANSEAGSILLYHAGKKKLIFEYVVRASADELTGVELEPDQGLAEAAPLEQHLPPAGVRLGQARGHLQRFRELTARAVRLVVQKEQQTQG